MVHLHRPGAILLGIALLFLILNFTYTFLYPSTPQYVPQQYQQPTPQPYSYITHIATNALKGCAFLSSAWLLITGLVRRSATQRPSAEDKVKRAQRTMARFAEKYARRTGTKFCRDRRVTARVIKGLAEHKVELGAPLCPCRDYEDKKEEVRKAYWNCPCVPMRTQGHCHCMLFLQPDSPWASEAPPKITVDDIEDLVAKDFVTDVSYLIILCSHLMDLDSLSSHSSDVTLVVEDDLISTNQPQWSHQPLQLLSLSSDHEDGRDTVTISPEARDYFINTIGNRPVSVMVVCGLYRTGKSFLLNLLSSTNNQAFTVGSTVNACTSGIWMLASNASNNGPVYILLDCEGSGNVEHDRDHDSTLFALATLLSGYFIYNSKGVIDEGAIQTLSVVTSLAQHIQQAQGDQDDDSSQRATTTAPHFLWVLRDFVLSLEDQNARPISAQEYLEIALSDKSSVAAYRSQESRDCREKLCKLFTHRDCIALVTPVIDEDQLQRLDTVPYTQLRQEFRDQVELLKRKVYRDCAPKCINGVPVTGVTFAKLLDQYVSSINKKEIPKVGSVWQALQAQEGEKLVEECSAEYRHMIDDKVEIKLPISEVDLNADLKALRHEIYSKFKRNALGEKKVVMQYREHLKDIMDEIDQHVKGKNDTIANEECLRVLKGLWRPIVDRLEAYDDNEGYSIDDGITQFTRDLSQLREAYQKEARGPSTIVMEVYSKWMTPKQEQGLLKLTQRQQEAAAQRAVMAERERAIEEEKRKAEKELEERRAKEKAEREKYREERTEKMRNDVKKLVVDIEGIDTPSSVEGQTDDTQDMRDSGRMLMQAEVDDIRLALDEQDRKRASTAAASCCRCTIM